MGDTRAPATRTEHPDLYEVAVDYSEDEDYDPEADEVESFDDHVDDLFAAHKVERQGNANNEKKDTDFWEVDVIENGVTSCMELTVKEALALPPRRKIVLQHNRELQQVGQAAGLLSGFLGTLGVDFQQLPICETSWKRMNKAFKEHAFDQVKRVFHYEDDGRGRIKRKIIQRIGRSWRNTRNLLFHKVYDKELTFEENVNRKPPGIDGNHWKWFLEYQLKEDTHVTNIELIEAIEHIEGQDASSKELSQNDSLAQVFGKEHPGRVCGLGFGPCPTQYFRNIPQQSNSGVQIEEYQMKIVKLKAEAAEVKAATTEEKAKRQRMEVEAAEEKRLTTAAIYKQPYSRFSSG
ncbi:uncharacterized protein LOC110271615 [Arachis ipaensis]|uniref:uncharacterized protein LOC110271615 n=1 Tax=Arachis ipaensis TaxID=130454 RepID=UPI000A2B519C|nr:uncharacterized protein LOC110271615 [Arachis ipaensis]